MAVMGFVMVSPASAAPAIFAGSTLCAGADNVYCNGAINGSVDAWTINFGFSVSDSFTLSGTTTITGADFGVWLSPGDVVKTVDWCITNSAFCGDTLATTSTVSLGPADECDGGSCNLGTNAFGYNIESLKFSFGGGIVLGAGTYYLTLQNAVANSGNAVYWDENSGPSVAAENLVGSIPSEAFAIDGTSSGTPEPQTMALIGSAALLFGGALRRKLRR
jgi:hypothetical protein